MVKAKLFLPPFLILFFLLFSFYPTIFELNHSNRLADAQREFILEHNYYWPDYNLYLSKIRQRFEGRWMAIEKYTSEPHRGSLIQEFYLVLGHIGKAIGLDPNGSYLLGRILFAPMLLVIILMLCWNFFSRYTWRLLSFLIVTTSASFPKFLPDPDGGMKIVRYMEWWSNIDALQRITFIPHILFGQVVSFWLLYRLVIRQRRSDRAFPQGQTLLELLTMIFFGIAVGIVFPPSLITLISTLLILTLIEVVRKKRLSRQSVFLLLFSTASSLSLLYLFVITKQFPWSALVEFHRTHPMMIPFWDYIMGTGPVFFLGFIGMIVAVVRRERRFNPLIFWVLTTLLFAILFTHIKEQSPLRFTQTGLFIPLGILTSYLFYRLYHLGHLGNLGYLWRPAVITIVSLYILANLFMMKNSLDWQTTWITQRLGANIPPVPYPPQAMYPLRQWMDGIRWLRDNTAGDDVVLADITAGNYIPAYAGNTVYFGQANTVDYERKHREVIRFFEGKMSQREAELFFRNGRITYIFYSIQEKERSGGKKLEDMYSGIKVVFTNSTTTLYSVD